MYIYIYVCSVYGQSCALSSVLCILYSIVNTTAFFQRFAFSKVQNRCFVCLISCRNVSVGPTPSIFDPKSSWGPCKFRKFGPPKTADFVMAAKQRLQELFAKYDTSGDGVLSEEEMLSVPLTNVFFF